MPTFSYAKPFGTKPPTKFSTQEAYQLHLPYQQATGTDKRVLFVLEHVPSEDLASGKLLSGATGDLLMRLLDNQKGEAGRFSWMAINFNQWKTYDQSDAFQQDSAQHFGKRVRAFIERFKPTSIVVLGRSAMYSMSPELSKYERYNVYGHPLDHDGIPITAVPALYRMVEDSDPKGNGPTNLLGYVARCLRNAVTGTNKYDIRWDERSAGFKYERVASVEQFDSMLEQMRLAKVVSIDTETDGLGRVSSKLLTIQFCFDGKTAWFVPYLHKETPFSPDALKHIRLKLRAFFEGKNKNLYHIYANGKFDLCQFRSNLGVRWFKNRLWDVQNADFILDENLKFLKQHGYLPNFDGSSSPGYYALSNLGAQYGAFPYIDISFGKDDRATIADIPLSDALVAYACTDVLLPYWIHVAQRQRGKDMEYKKYISMVLDQESDKVHSFAEMESNGIYTEIDYLFYLDGPDSPIHKSIADGYRQIYESKEARRLNSKLISDRGTPQQDLFGGYTQALDFSKPDHRRRFFFEELGLEPVSVGKSGEGSLNKAFKAHYKDHPFVKALDQLAGSEQLRGLFVNKFIDIYNEGGDIRVDSCIRPSFNATGVATGRVAEYDPNMQQLPNRGLGPLIKRSFVAPPGFIYLKSDYNSHEVRGWSVISFDTVLGDVFRHGVELRKQYREDPDDALAKRIFLEGDSHRLNVAYFFNIDLTKIDLSNKKHTDRLDTLRGQIKGIIFGLIYGMHNATLARNLGKEKDEIDQLVDKMFKRFRMGHKWLVQIEESGRVNLYVESPLGRRRNLYSNLAVKSMPGFRTICAASDRKARNSPIQGMCSDFNFISCRNLTNKLWERRKLLGNLKEPSKFRLTNVVHDSMESVVTWDWMWWAIDSIHKSMTTDVQEIVKRRHGFDFAVPLEIDIEIGGSLAKTFKWDWSLKSLTKALANTAVYNQRELGHDLDPAKTLRKVFKNMDEAPDFIHRQVGVQGIPNIKEAVKVAEEAFVPSEYAKKRYKYR